MMIGIDNTTNMRLSKTSAYITWTNMKNRVQSYILKDSMKHAATIDPSWLDFTNFYEWINKQDAYSPESTSYTLTRRDPALPFGPKNCELIPRDILKSQKLQQKRSTAAEKRALKLQVAQAREKALKQINIDVEAKLTALFANHPTQPLNDLSIRDFCLLLDIPLYTSGSAEQKMVRSTIISWLIKHGWDVAYSSKYPKNAILCTASIPSASLRI